MLWNGLFVITERGSYFFSYIANGVRRISGYELSCKNEESEGWLFAALQCFLVCRF